MAFSFLGAAPCRDVPDSPAGPGSAGRALGPTLRVHTRSIPSFLTVVNNLFAVRS